MDTLPRHASTDSALRPPTAVARLALAWGCVVALSLPLLFLAVGYQGEAVRLESALRFGAHIAADDGGRRRAASSFDARAAARVVEAIGAGAGGTAVRILDADGQALAALGGDPPGPAVRRSAPLFAGVSDSPRLEMTQSLRPLLLHALAILLPGLLLGWVATTGLRLVPMRAFRLTLWEASVRREAEQRLAKSLSLFAATLESTADAILVTDVQGRAVVCNQRFLQLWNGPRGAAPGSVDPDAMFAIASWLRDPAGFLETQKDLNRQIGVDHGEVLELRDGRLFEWNSRPQLIDGEVVGRVSSFRDISERKRAEALLAAEKEVLEMVVCGTPLTAALGVLARRLETLSGHMFCAILFREGESEAFVSVATGASLPRPFADAIVQDAQPTLEAVLADLDGIDGHDGVDAEDRLGPVIEQIACRPAWNDYHDRLQPLDIVAGCAASVRSDAGPLMGVIVGHYRPGTALPNDDRDLMRVAAHLARIAIERRQVEARLRFLAHYDALTYLPNRDLFRDRLTQALGRASRHGDCVAVMFLDLDRFKTINDTLGHEAGDLMLREVSARLRACVREEDTVARLGGDEFTIILHQVRRPDDAAIVAGKILETLAAPILLGNRETFATPSIGVSIYPTDGTSAEVMIRHADTAMYRAKKDGGNGYRFFDPAMNLLAEDRLELESGLRRALERDEFVVHYQPKLDLATGAITSAEALIRWRHPQRGLVSPAEFVPILEETGLIEAVGAWVLRTVCAQIRAWQADGLPPLTVAVNLSGRQLQHNDIAETIGRILEEMQVEPRLLELEVTESMLMLDPDYAAEMLDRIRGKGVEHITVDDFGTGYSSLSYLKRFPIDTLKLDKSFVDGLPRDPDNLAISRAVIALGHSLRMKVVAEGVETLEQRSFLKAEGCDVIQGYVLSGAIPADALASLVRQQLAHRQVVPHEGASVVRLPVGTQDASATDAARTRRQA